MTSKYEEDEFDEEALLKSDTEDDEDNSNRVVTLPYSTEPLLGVADEEAEEELDFNDPDEPLVDPKMEIRVSRHTEDRLVTTTSVDVIPHSPLAIPAPSPVAPTMQHQHRGSLSMTPQAPYQAPPLPSPQIDDDEEQEEGARKRGRFIEERVIDRGSPMRISSGVIPDTLTISEDQDREIKSFERQQQQRGRGGGRRGSYGRGRPRYNQPYQQQPQYYRGPVPQQQQQIHVNPHFPGSVPVQDSVRLMYPPPPPQRGFPQPGPAPPPFYGGPQQPVYPPPPPGGGPGLLGAQPPQFYPLPPQPAARPIYGPPPGGPLPVGGPPQAQPPPMQPQQQQFMPQQPPPLQPQPQPLGYQQQPPPPQQFVPQQQQLQQPTGFPQPHRQPMGPSPQIPPLMNPPPPRPTGFPPQRPPLTIIVPTRKSNDEYRERNWRDYYPRRRSLSPTLRGGRRSRGSHSRSPPRRRRADTPSPEPKKSAQQAELSKEIGKELGLGDDYYKMLDAQKKARDAMKAKKAAQRKAGSSSENAVTTSASSSRRVIAGGATTARTVVGPRKFSASVTKKAAELAKGKLVGQAAVLEQQQRSSMTANLNREGASARSVAAHGLNKKTEARLMRDSEISSGTDDEAVIFVPQPHSQTESKNKEAARTLGERFKQQQQAQAAKRAAAAAQKLKPQKPTPSSTASGVSGGRTVIPPNVIRLSSQRGKANSASATETINTAVTNSGGAATAQRRSTKAGSNQNVKREILGPTGAITGHSASAAVSASPSAKAADIKGPRVVLIRGVTGRLTVGSISNWCVIVGPVESVSIDTATQVATAVFKYSEHAQKFVKTYKRAKIQKVDVTVELKTKGSDFW